jgi:hypothetical protein
MKEEKKKKKKRRRKKKEEEGRMRRNPTFDSPPFLNCSDKHYSDLDIDFPLMNWN